MEMKNDSDGVEDRMTNDELDQRGKEIMQFVRETDAELLALNQLRTAMEDSPFVRRTIVRTLFSIIESQVAQLKKAALLTAIVPNAFRPEEILILQDLEYIVDKGSLKSRRAKIRFLDNYSLAFTLFHRLERPDFNIDFGTQGAGDFKGAIKIRDRVTHPKGSADWALNEEDMALVWRGWDWHHQQMTNALRL